jgi:5'-3' exonuclease
VRGERVLQMDVRRKKSFDAQAVRRKFGVEPALIPDFLALVGDAADGYPGISGIGSVTAARLLNQHGAIEEFPKQVLGQQHGLALRFKALATLRTDAPLFCNVDELLWRGATESFASCTQRLDAPRLLARSVGIGRAKLSGCASF